MKTKDNPTKLTIVTIIYHRSLRYHAEYGKKEGKSLRRLLFFVIVVISIGVVVGCILGNREMHYELNSTPERRSAIFAGVLAMTIGFSVFLSLAVGLLYFGYTWVCACQTSEAEGKEKASEGNFPK